VNKTEQNAESDNYYANAIGRICFFDWYITTVSKYTQIYDVTLPPTWSR